MYGYLKTRLNKPVSEPSIPSGRTADVDKSHRILGHDSVIFNIEVCTLCVRVCVCVCVCLCLYVVGCKCGCICIQSCVRVSSYFCLIMCLDRFHISGCMVVNNICLCASMYVVRNSVMGSVASIPI